jgi:adenylate cyclase
MVVPRRQQLHSRVADILASRQEKVPVDLANHLLTAARYDEAVAMCVAAAADALKARAYKDAGELLERAAPHVHDQVERARMLCRAADAYWNNSEPANAKRLLEQGIPDLESAALNVEAAGYRVLLGRCFWELMKSDLAEEQFQQARIVLEAVGPSEALAIAYVRLAGMATFNSDNSAALHYATLGLQTAEAAGADLARAWSLIFMAGAEVGLGQIDAGLSHADEGYEAAVAGGYQFQVGNVVFNTTWEAVHLARVDALKVWVERLARIGPSPDDWPQYMRGLVALYSGRVRETIDIAVAAGPKARDAGYQKMVWRISVLHAHALAENMRPEAAAAVLPPMSSRVDTQDATYDTAARVRTRLAAGDAAGAEADARTVPVNACKLASPADAVAEAVQDASWLRAFLDSLPVRGQVLESPRLGVARGRLALLEGRHADAIELLEKADAEFRRGGLHLDAWHVGRALAEAQFRVGEVEAAQRRLLSIIAEAEPAGALLAAKLARETAARLGLEIGAVSEKTEAAPGAPRFATGERMVSVLFADVRGYTELAGQSAPADLADRIATLQRWAAQEVGRRYGIVDKFAGDAIMATFNVSGQSVDHALAAVRAAIAIIDKAALAGLPVGAGVAVGPAIVGSLADSANLSVLGEATNLAARLQAGSAPGEVTLSEEAYRRVSGWLESQGIRSDRVELELKGIAGPVPAYRVAASTVAASPA